MKPALDYGATPPTAHSLHCHDCEAHAEPAPGKMLPDGWGMMWRPDDFLDGQLGPFYGCPEHLDPTFYGTPTDEL